MATFTTSKSVGQNININVETSTSYWKYNHNETDSSVFSNGSQLITVTNENGEFTIISCLADSTVSGDITTLDLSGNQLTSFDGRGLSSVTLLDLKDNPLTTFIGGDLQLLSKIDLRGRGFLSGWNITTLESIDITDMDNLQYLYVEDNRSINNKSVNNSLLAKLAANELANDWDSGEFFTGGGRTSAGTTDYDYLISNSWNISGADSVSRKLRVRGIQSLK